MQNNDFLLTVLNNEAKNKALHIVAIIIISLLISLQIYDITKFVYNYSYCFDYGKSLRDVCLSAYNEYETSRFQMSNNLDKIKIQNDNYSTNNAYDILLLMIALLVSFYLSFILATIVSDGTAYIEVIKRLWNEDLEILSKLRLIIKLIVISCILIYICFMPLIYFILKITDTSDISPFQIEAPNIGGHIIAIIAILSALIYYHIKDVNLRTQSLSIKLMIVLVFCLGAYVLTRITDNYFKDLHMKYDLSYYENINEDTNIPNDYLLNILGLKNINVNPSSTQKNVVFILGIIVFGLVSFLLMYYIMIRYKLHLQFGMFIHVEDFDILHMILIPLVVLFMVVFIITVNQEYNTNINKYILLQPDKIYKQNVEKINKIFNQIVENDKSSIENKSFCLNQANAVHLAIYSNIFRVQGSEIKDMFIPKFEYEKCDESFNIDYNSLRNYNINTYINEQDNVFYENDQCKSVKNNVLITVMLNCIPIFTGKDSSIDDININVFLNNLLYSLQNINTNKTYDGTKQLEYSNNYEANNVINYNLQSSDKNYSTINKHIQKVLDAIVDEYKKYLMKMYLETIKTVKAICHCNNTEDITNETYKKELSEKIAKLINNNNSSYTTTLKKEYINIFLDKTKEFFTKVNALMSSEIVENDNNYKLSKFIIRNYNSVQDSEFTRYKGFQLKAYDDKTEAIPNEMYKDIENIVKIIKKLNSVVVAGIKKDDKNNITSSYSDAVASEYNNYFEEFKTEYNSFIKIFKLTREDSENYFDQLIYEYKNEYLKSNIDLHYGLLFNAVAIKEYQTKFDEIKKTYETKYANVWKLSNNIFKKELTINNSNIKIDSKKATERAQNTSLTSYILIAVYAAVIFAAINIT